ncbi:MAG: 23S rRNA (adenine(2030)-N(6))-methyltransferase RlmJ [Rhodocyclaceae bacterium]|nr:23S rRNA (adenine(2030)-N(6))-methyltransferase RlmJ [Rhodocyclaceae bacterium]
MLSYRHAFHAGNHADVLKHVVLLELLDYLKQKDKPFLAIDTHAGAGRYALDSEQAQKIGEYKQGIARLWRADDLPPALARYVAAVRDFNRGGELQFYPGSPVLVQTALRDEDRLRLFELHPTDHGFLQKAFPAKEKRVTISREDGFAALKALLPPPSRRALVLIDPAYERREEYRVVVETLKDALKRFPAGCYAIWYPRLQKTESKQLVERLQKLAPPAWLHVWLDVTKPSRDGFGMHGSGLFVINPPWTLPETLAAVMPVLQARLALDEDARFGIEHQIP